MSDQIPLFPLNSVLFPTAPISLHIFEERYRTMIKRCLDRSEPFGIVLIRSGSEVSPDDPWVRRMRENLSYDDDPIALKRGPIPYSVGTIARISESVKLEDGRYYLVAVGLRRFRIQYLVQREPFLVGAVQYLADDIGQATQQHALQLRQTYARYWESICTATGQEYEAEPLPEDITELSYWMANQLRVDNHRKQRWLEGDASLRLREMAAAIRAEIALLPAGAPDTAGVDVEPWTWN